MGSLLEQSVCLSPVSPLSSWCSQGKLGTVLALPVDGGEKVSVAGLQFGTTLPGKDVCQDCLPVQRQVLSVGAAVRLQPHKRKGYKSLVHRQEVSCP